MNAAQSRRLLWALDLDREGRPTAAHLVTDDVPKPGDGRDLLATECGHHYSWNDHIGWWITQDATLPLALEKVHCGLPAPLPLPMPAPLPVPHVVVRPADARG